MRRGFTLGELIVVVLVLSLLMCLFLPLAREAGFKNAKITNCGSHLSQLTRAMYEYSITGCAPEGSFPSGPLGGEWWRLLHKNGAIDDRRVLWCPVAAANTTVGATDYWGPAVNPNTLGSGDAIGCDRPGNHGDDPDVALNWVAKSGDVHKTPASSPKWASIRRTVKP